MLTLHLACAGVILADGGGESLLAGQSGGVGTSGVSTKQFGSGGAVTKPFARPGSGFRGGGVALKDTLGLQVTLRLSVKLILGFVKRPGQSGVRWEISPAQQNFSAWPSLQAAA